MFLLLQCVAICLVASAWAQGSSSRLGTVVEVRNMTVPAGSEAVLPCHSPRMVWTRDRLRDRQRVVHWDLVRAAPAYSVERILDMSPGAGERVYNGFNKGRVTIPDTAFSDGNFSLVIHNVGATDRGVYTCNLHHHYCQIHQSIKILLNTTKSARKEKRYWDGEKTVFVVLLGRSVVLPCVNRRPLWREGLQEDQQQVAHWDFQPPGVRADGAERLVDLYASGEKRQYGPLAPRSRMALEDDAFSLGDFSLSVTDLQPRDQGLYSCHLHHHYCGLHERRVFRLTVGPRLTPVLPPVILPPVVLPPVVLPPVVLPPVVVPPETPNTLPNDQPRKYDDRMEDTEVLVEHKEVLVEHKDVLLDRPRVVNVILPEHRGHFLQQLGYILATFLLLAFIVAAVIVLTRRRRKRELEYDMHRSERRHMTSGGDLSLDITELKTCNQEHLNSNYKNNLLKERADMSKDCSKDMDEKFWK